MSWPGYSYEYGDGAIDVITRPPAARAGRGRRRGRPARTSARPWTSCAGHPMAKAALSTAMLDVWLRERAMSLAAYLGAVRDACRLRCLRRHPARPSRSPSCSTRSAGYVDGGLPPHQAEDRAGLGPRAGRAPCASAGRDIPLQIDANQAYTARDAAHLAAARRVRPAAARAAARRRRTGTATSCSSQACRRRSAWTSRSSRSRRADSAIRLRCLLDHQHQAGPGRRLPDGREIHDLCLRTRASRCGAAACSRPASVARPTSRSPRCPGFTLPGDTSASSRYYAVDVTEPFVLDDGRLAVPTGPGHRRRPDPGGARRPHGVVDRSCSGSATATRWRQALVAGGRAATPVTRDTENVRTCSVRWSKAVRTPPWSRIGSTICWVTVPSLSA